MRSATSAWSKSAADDMVQESGPKKKGERGGGWVPCGGETAQGVAFELELPTD